MVVRVSRQHLTEVEERECEFPHCADCHLCGEALDVLTIVAADLGDGAFLAVLCEVCWHRRQYRSELKRRLGRAFRGESILWFGQDGGQGEIPLR